MSTDYSLPAQNLPEKSILKERGIVFLNNLDLSDVASSVEDDFHILLADVVVVARRWSHLDRDLTKDSFANTISFCQIRQNVKKRRWIPRCSPVPSPREGISWRGKNLKYWILDIFNVNEFKSTFCHSVLFIFISSAVQRGAPMIVINIHFWLRIVSALYMDKAQFGILSLASSAI